MEHARRRGPNRHRRLIANLLALVVGVGLSWFGIQALFEFAPPRLHRWPFAALLVIGWGGSAFVAAELRDALLSRWGVALRPAPSPRLPRAILAYGAGCVAGAIPVIAAWAIASALSYGMNSMSPIRVSPSIAVFGGLAAPTVGLLVARELCRRWWTAPSAGAQAPAGSPAPAPA